MLVEDLRQRVEIRGTQRDSELRIPDLVVVEKSDIVVVVVVALHLLEVDVEAAVGIVVAVVVAVVVVVVTVGVAKDHSVNMVEVLLRPSLTRRRDYVGDLVDVDDCRWYLGHSQEVYGNQ